MEAKISKAISCTLDGATLNADGQAISAPGLPPPENKRYYPALDGLRAFAVLLVFFHHYRPEPHSLLEWGWVAVDLFFVLSGFLITGILFDTRDQAHRYSNFYWRRVLRIFPLYYAIWIGAALATPLLHLVWSPRWILWPLYFGNFTHIVAQSPVPQETLDWVWNGAGRTIPWIGNFFSFGHLWSLSVEEQFYLIWPCLVFSLKKRSALLKVCLAVFIGMPVIRLGAYALAPQALLAREFLYRSTFFRVDALLLGGAVALVQRGPRADLLFRYCTRVGAVTLLLLFATRWFAVHLQHQSPFGSPLTPWISIVGFTYVDLISASVLLLAVQETSFLSRVFRFPALQWLGRLSYGFYVFHDLFHAAYITMAIRLANRSHLGPAYVPQITIVLALLCTTLLAAISFRFFERPFLLLKSRFTRT